MRNVICFLLLLLFGCCNSFSKKPDFSHSLFYADIDIFKMKGIGLIKGDRPIAPCFEISSIDTNNIVLTTWFLNKKKHSRTYIKKNGYWLSLYPILSDTLDLIAHDYIGVDKIIQLQYQNDSSKYNLKIATVLKDSIQKIYLFKSNIRIMPNVDIDFDNKQMVDHLEGEGTNEFHIKNGNLQLVRTSIIKYPETIYRDTSYFKINGHSIYWWSEFGDHYNDK